MINVLMCLKQINVLINTKVTVFYLIVWRNHYYLCIIKVNIERKKAKMIFFFFTVRGFNFEMNENLTNKFYISFMSSLSLGNSDQCYLKQTELLSQDFIFINTRKKY